MAWDTICGEPAPWRYLRHDPDKKCFQPVQDEYHYRCHKHLADFSMEQLARHTPETAYWRSTPQPRVEKVDEVKLADVMRRQRRAIGVEVQ